MKMRIMYKIRKLIVRYKQRIKSYRENKIFSKMTNEQLRIYNMVKDIVINNRSSVKLDPYSNEILIVLPKMLITLKHDMIYVDNTNGFLSIRLNMVAHDMLKKLIYTEIHRERRKLKYEVKGRIHDFIDKVAKENK